MYKKGKLESIRLETFKSMESFKRVKQSGPDFTCTTHNIYIHTYIRVHIQI